uniref:chondroitin sulfate synthase sqv-5 isoform X1 n=1 Tax=Ciona intestinalis TaxID=7719 RepID=UPI000180CDD0|nr:chondroitin sulfate synthase sqv-5 isoform X1 [Ciona intestinalis]|eukprot:XP_002130637.1 chondroitin sulfate synthase sqv-5 isoform X1 [Ciona intestinalis]
MRKRRLVQNTLRLVSGYACGLLLHYFLLSSKPKVCNEIRNDVLIRGGKRNVVERHSSPVLPQSNIYLGMMSAEKFIDNRVQRALDTWLQKGSWKVEVFADATPDSLQVPAGLDFNIVTLRSVDDAAYPPQKKCFMMLRHMYDHHIDNYDWFMRVDDDVYMDFPRLSKLLNTINSSMPVFFGTPGFGMDPDDGIEDGMFYLMGGPGMIFSRGLLLELRAHFSHCIQHMFSPHEDVEIGRCVWKHAKKAKIPIAWETIEFFYQQYDKNTGAVTNVVMADTTEQRTAKTVAYHAVKKHDLLYTLHRQVLERRIKKLLNETAKLKREIQAMQTIQNMKEISSLTPYSKSSPLPYLLGSNTEMTVLSKSRLSHWPITAAWLPQNPMIPRGASTIPAIFWDKYYRHQVDSVIPARGHQGKEQPTLLKYLSEIENGILKKSCPHLSSNPQFTHGYLWVLPQHGAFISVAHKGLVKGEYSYCTTHVQVSFAVTLLGEKDHPLSEHPLIAPSLVKRQSLVGYFVGEEIPPARKRLHHHSNTMVRYQEPVLPVSFDSSKDRVLFVIPLHGRYRALELFMERYKRDFLNPLKEGKIANTLSGNVQLVIVLLGARGDEHDMNRASAYLLHSYQQEFGTSLIRYHIADTGKRQFSRGAGLQLGSLVAGINDIVFFMDIDMIVTPNLVAQCRRNVKHGKQAWYPIPYSQYDPDRQCYDGSLARSVDERSILNGADPAGDSSLGRSGARETIRQTPLTLEEDRGFWRDFGYGIACFYNTDFVSSGGFDLSIEGWGEEDVRLYKAILASGVDVFRSKQSDLVHIYHTKHCDQRLVGEQARSCHRTKASHYASQMCLAKTYFQRNNLS